MCIHKEVKNYHVSIVITCRYLKNIFMSRILFQMSYLIIYCISYLLHISAFYNLELLIVGGAIGFFDPHQGGSKDFLTGAGRKIEAITNSSLEAFHSFIATSLSILHERGSNIFFTCQGGRGFKYYPPTSIRRVKQNVQPFWNLPYSQSFFLLLYVFYFLLILVHYNESHWVLKLPGAYIYYHTEFETPSFKNY